jgi:hypothetical protein
VRALPIANRPEVKMPSVVIGPMKCWMAGVRRNGTASFEKKAGLVPANPTFHCEILVLCEHTVCSGALTRYELAHVDLSRPTRDVETSWQAT